MNEDSIAFTPAQDPAVDQVQVSPSISDDLSWYSSHLGHRAPYFAVMGRPAHIPGFVLQSLSHGHMPPMLL